jgi:hypothetical protein
MTPEVPCPLCGQELDQPSQIYVCDPCHRGLQADGAVPVHATGEFTAVRIPPATRRSRAPTVPGDQEPASCSWCGRGAGTVKKLLSHGDAHICNECVALCSDIMESELGPNWRG